MAPKHENILILLFFTIFNLFQFFVKFVKKIVHSIQGPSPGPPEVRAPILL